MSEKPKHEPQEVADKVLELLASCQGLTVGQGVEVLEGASIQLRAQAYEAMTKESARPISEVFEAKPDIKVVSAIH